jgi:alanine dehydrogenase
MKLGIIREGKNPPDNRVPLTPEQCVEVEEKFPDVEVLVQSSNVRCFSDDDYKKAGITVQKDVSDCDILIGVKEVPVADLIPGKIYFFFSHTIKKQEYNRKLLQTILQKKIQLVDYEVLTDKSGLRIIGFGRFAGLVGAYSGIRGYGLRKEIFRLKPAYKCDGLNEMFAQLDIIELPPVKIAITGDGRVARGSLEVLSHMKIKQLSPEEYVKVQNPEEAVFAQLSPRDYVRRKDGSEFNLNHFFKHPEMYDNAFLPFAKTTDILIAAAYWDPKSPALFMAEDMRRDDFQIQMISDITCDIEGSIPSTKWAATIDNPFYDYNPVTEKVEPAFVSPKNITVQAVDNLPNELPKDASQDFGRNLIDKVFPSLFENDNEGIIERASIAKSGKLTERFAYLQDFVEGN